MTRYIPTYYQQLSLDQSKPLLNHATQVAQPRAPYSKSLQVSARSNEKVVSPDFHINCPGHLYSTAILGMIGSEQEYVCYLDSVMGGLIAAACLAWSCNLYFNKVGGGYKDEVPEGLGIDRLGQYAHALGYGEISGD